jgi:hypothetical protein
VIAVQALNVLGSIQWDPEIRNLLSLLVGVGVLIGSVYLLLATNLGARLGLMVAMAALFGWIAGMGVVWWIYGIGMKGEASHWQVVEINIDDLSVSGVTSAQTLPEPVDLPDPAAVLAEHPELTEVVIPPGQEGKQPSLGELVEADPALLDELGLRPDDLGGWTLLIPSDPQRGDAVATADAALGPDGEAQFDDASEYKVLDVFSEGGKERLAEDAVCKPRFVHPVWEGCWERAKHKLLSIWHWRHPTHYAVVQVQEVIHPCTEGQEPTAAAPCVVVPEGSAPPPPQVDPSKPVLSVIMVRDLGDLRFPAAMVTVVFTSLFALTCWRLHARDKLVMAHRAEGGS